MLLLSAY